MDLQIRELERQATSGDVEALHQLREIAKRGVISPAIFVPCIRGEKRKSKTIHALDPHIEMPHKKRFHLCHGANRILGSSFLSYPNCFHCLGRIEKGHYEKPNPRSKIRGHDAGSPYLIFNKRINKFQCPCGYCSTIKI